MRTIDADALFAEVKSRHDMYKGCTYIGDKARQDELGAFMGDIVNAPTIGSWISVKDRLPEENEAVNIVWMNTEPESYYEHIKGKPFVATGVYFHGRWYWWSSIVQDYLAEYGSCEVDEMDKVIVITHWMPIPEPPKEAVKDG